MTPADGYAKAKLSEINAGIQEGIDRARQLHPDAALRPGHPLYAEAEAIVSAALWAKRILEHADGADIMPEDLRETSPYTIGPAGMEVLRRLDAAQPGGRKSSPESIGDLVRLGYALLLKGEELKRVIEQGGIEEIESLSVMWIEKDNLDLCRVEGRPARKSRAKDKELLREILEEKTIAYLGDRSSRRTFKGLAEHLGVDRGLIYNSPDYQVVRDLWSRYKEAIKIRQRDLKGKARLMDRNGDR